MAAKRDCDCGLLCSAPSSALDPQGNGLPPLALENILQNSTLPSLSPDTLHQEPSWALPRAVLVPAAHSSVSPQHTRQASWGEGWGDQEILREKPHLVRSDNG